MGKLVKKPKRTKDTEPKKLHIGLVHLEFIKLQIPVFQSDEDRVTFLRSKGFPAELEDQCFLALVSVCRNQEGMVSISAVIPPETSLSTLVHETVHIVDFAMEHVGIATEPANTETRAYMTQHVWEQLYDILVSLQKRTKTSSSLKEIHSLSSK